MLKRIVIVVLAYLAACIVAGLMINFELLGWKLIVEGDRPSGLSSTVEAIGALLLLSLLVGAYVAVFALLPFVVALALMLRLGWTSPRSAVVAGALVGLVQPVNDVLQWQIRGGGPANWVSSTLVFGAALAIAGACAALTFRAMTARALGLKVASAPPNPRG